MAFIFENTKIPEVLIISPQVHSDCRGYFMETYNKELFALNGIKTDFVQVNESSSYRGVLRGLHFQKKHTQGKLIRIIQGEVFDVAVDVRPGSNTFGQWVGVTLSNEKKNMVWIPAGFAHGFLALSDIALLDYKCTDYYDPSNEGGIPWDDPSIAIAWPKLDCEYSISEKDQKHIEFKNQCFDWAAKYL